MPPYKYKTGTPKVKQRKQMYVYTDNWVAMHNKIIQLEHDVKYWQIESDSNHAKWTTSLEDLYKLRKQYEIPPVNTKNKTKVRRD